LQDAAAGWGHSAFVSSDGALMVSGKPYDFSTLLRLRRLPFFIRQYVLEADAGGKDQLATSFIIGKVVSWMSGKDNKDDRWGEAQKNSLLLSPTKLDERIYTRIVASAGLTAAIDKDGTLLTFGLNQHGQCGVGEFSNNVWTPQPVMGLSTQFAHNERSTLKQEDRVTQVALGLQHALALDASGHLYAWGKGERGQLGLDATSLPYAMPVSKFQLPSIDGSQRWAINPAIIKIGAGMNHSVALSDDNLLFVWGKNVLPSKDKGADDAIVPTAVKGLPNKAIVDVTCGSHHTSVLLDDGSVYGFGIPRDSDRLVFEPVQQVPAGVIEMPCRQFQGHFDRTTIVGKSGDQVLQVQLWSDPDIQSHACFTPLWRDSLTSKVLAVHRGWLHSLIVTED